MKTQALFLICMATIICAIYVIAEQPFPPIEKAEEHLFTSKKGWLKVKSTGAGWHQGGIVLGDYYLWADASGNLRISNNKPNNANDGVIVGTQQ